MKNQSLFRYGGFAAILSAVLYVLSLGVSMSGGAGLGATFYILSSIFFLAVIIIEYLHLREQSNLLALLGLIYGVGFILFGWLQLRSPERPKGLGYLAMVTGGLSLVGGVTLFAGASFDVFGLFNLALSVPYVIWLVWLGVRYLKGATAGLQTA